MENKIIGITISKEYYEELLKKKDEPNIFLEQENEELKAELRTLKDFKLLYEEKVSSLKHEKPKTVNEQILEMFNELRLKGYKKVEAYIEIGKKFNKGKSTVGKIVTKGV
jgi:hypothetical protein